MSFLDIKYPAERATLVKKNVTTMQTPANREMKLAIGDELQTLFHPIVNATKRATEETRNILEPMKKTLTDIEALAVQRAAGYIPPLDKSVNSKFGIYSR